jgi:hypothetical protein
VELTKRENPFQHAIIADFLDATTLLQIAEWAQAGAKWHLHRGSFFECYIADLERLPEEFRTPLSPTSLGERLTSSLGWHLDAGRSRLILQRIMQGQSISVHTDRPVAGTETHRAIVYVGHTSGMTACSGGELVLMAGAEPSTHDVQYAPAANSGVAFEMSASSYHRVEQVQGMQPRFSLNYSYWSTSP